MASKMTGLMCSITKNMIRRQAHISTVCRMSSSSKDGETGPVHTEYEEGPLPEWQEKHGESHDIRKARLLYQSRKRGMLENGLLLSTFAAEYLNQMTDAELEHYDFLINKPSNDWEIYYWAVGVKEVPDEYKSPVMDQLKKHATNEKQESRVCQPDLYAKPK
ncbi:succinate dehydrogenase assembly factor 2, mitochondrial-like [Lineus longissimus]|uniref:succinate dehydrogenase assembly factor 2, mitochondrial-like n=1 Tax=Lineus longissimus TaxID=88925 RepID=UPI00315D8A98